MTEELLVPQYITKWGVLTSFVLLGFSFLTYKYKYYLLSILSLCVFISSVLHWHKMTLFGSTKIVDFILAASAFLLVTLYYNDILKGKYKRIWSFKKFSCSIIMNPGRGLSCLKCGQPSSSLPSAT